MDLKDAINMTVVIGGRSYPLKVHASDEQTIRDIEQELNSKIEKFQNTYRNKDKQDCIAMTLLTLAVDLHKHKQIIQNKSLDNQLSELDKLLRSVS